MILNNKESNHNQCREQVLLLVLNVIWMGPFCSRCHPHIRKYITRSLRYFWFAEVSEYYPPLNSSGKCILLFLNIQCHVWYDTNCLLRTYYTSTHMTKLSTGTVIWNYESFQSFTRNEVHMVLAYLWAMSSLSPTPGCW